MTTEQKKTIATFAKIAVDKDFHQVVYLAAVGAILQADDWRNKAEEIISLAEKSKECDDFAEALFKII